MMESIQDALLQDRREAGLILGMRLKPYEKVNAVVVGIPHSGVCVAATLANYLSLPLEAMPCKRIKHPANDSENLGAVSLNEVFLYDNSDRVPQDLIAHQIAMLRHANSNEYHFYHQHSPPTTLKYKTLILTDDLLKSSEVMLACIHEVKTQKPLKIIVAVPVVSAEAARIISAEVDEMVFLKMEQEVGHAKNYFTDYSRIGDDEVKKLIDSSRKSIINQ